jgi:hypothetical protein
MPTTPQTSLRPTGVSRLEMPAEAPARPGGLVAALKRSFLGAAWRAAKARRRDAGLRLGPAIARRRTALAAGAAARLRALAETRPDRALALARRLAPRAPAAAAAAAVLTARIQGWRAAAPLFARLGADAAAGGFVLRREAAGPGLDLASPARDRAAAFAPEAAAGVVVYTTRLGSLARIAPPDAAIPGFRFVCLSDRDDPAEGWEVAPLRAPEGAGPGEGPGVDFGLAAELARIDPEAALAEAAPAARASLYLAPDLLLAGNLDTLFARWLADADVAAWRHPHAVGWQDLAETAALAAQPGPRRDAVLAAAEACEAARLPRDAGAISGRMLWRRHGTAAATGLAAAWRRAFLRHPGDAELALAQALLDPAPPPAPRILPAALGSATDNLFAAALPPARAARGRPPAAAGRPKVAIVYARGYEHYAASMLRAEQLAGLLAERLGDRFDIVYTPETAGLRDHVVVLSKWALGARRPDEIAGLRAKNVAVVASWDDMIPSPAIAAVVDAQMSLSLAQTIELNRRFPDAPTYHVAHHVNRLIRPQAPPRDRLRTGYFGELFNTVRPASLARVVELNGVATTGKSSASVAWMDALDRYNCHWIVRRRHPFDGAKPFLKGFVAARCGAVVVVARDDGDAGYYLGDDYPFYVRGLDAATLEADWLAVASAFGGPDWRLAEAIMRQVAARSADGVVCGQFRAMVEAIAS